MAAFGAAIFLTTFLAKRLVPHVQHTSTGGLTTTISDSNGAAVLGCSDQRTLVRAPEGAAVYQRVRLLPRPFRAAQMQKWRRVGGAGGGLPPVVTVIDWGGGGLVDPPDFREIHVIRGDLKTPAEVHGRPQRKRSTASQCQLAPLPASHSTDAKNVNRPNPQAGGRTRERCDCAADFPLLAEDLQGTAGLQPFLTQTQTQSRAALATSLIRRAALMHAATAMQAPCDTLCDTPCESICNAPCDASRDAGLCALAQRRAAGSGQRRLFSSQPSPLPERSLLLAPYPPPTPTPSDRRPSHLRHACTNPRRRILTPPCPSLMPQPKSSPYPDPQPHQYSQLRPCNSQLGLASQLFYDE